MRLVLAWEMGIFIGLFFSYFRISGGGEFGAFSRFFLLGTVIQLFLMGILCLLILSEVVKQNIKERFWMPVSDGAMIFFIGLIQLAIFLANIQTLYGLSFFSKSIEFTDTLVYSLVGAVLVVGAGVLWFRAEKKQILTTLYVENSQTTSAQFDEYREVLEKSASKKNMSLPV
jgi:hypothetical protein